MERRGVECTHKIWVKAKARATNMEKRGVEYASQDPAVKAKVRATNMEKRGVEYAMQDPAVQAKARATNMEKRGVEYTYKIQRFKQKCELPIWRNVVLNML